jgi:hypothetical protein
MQWIASWKSWNVTALHYPSVRERVLQLIRNWYATKLLDPTEHQRSLNDLLWYQYVKWIAICPLWSITNESAVLIGKRELNMVTATFWIWVSTERQQFLVLQVSQLERNFTIVIHNQRIGRSDGQRRKKHGCNAIPKMRVNRVSTECFWFRCRILCNSWALLQHVLRINLLAAIMEKEIVTWSHPWSENER